MPNRDALWVLPDGRTTVVTLDENGEPVEPIPGTEPTEPTPSAEPAPATPRRTKRKT